MKRCPNAKLFVHPLGKVHLCEPDRLEIFIDIRKNAWKKENDVNKIRNAVSKKNYEKIKYNLIENGLPLKDPFYETIKPDIDFCTSGLILYLKRIKFNS